MPDLPPPSRRRRALRMFLLMTAFGLIGAAAVMWYLQVGQWSESTDNAYLRGNMVNVSSKVPGVVVYIANQQNDYVVAGAPLIKLSSGDASRALTEAKNILGFAVREVMTRRARVKTAESELRLRETTQGQAQQEYQRRQRLLSKKMVSQEEVDAARTRYEETHVELDTARNELREAEVQAGIGDIRQHPMIRVAASRLHESYRQLNKHTLYAPVSGRVAQRRVQAGQVIDAGAPLITLIEENNFWIEANFKETQLQHLRPGQPVDIKADVFGDQQIFSGRVSSVGGGTGATFAVLPAQNATGNWIKIVQRVPVRIDFNDPSELASTLPIGASLEVRVDTHDRGGERISTENLGQVSPTAFYEDLDGGVEQLIDQVIEENLTMVVSSAGG